MAGLSTTAVRCAAALVAVVLCALSAAAVGAAGIEATIARIGPANARPPGAVAIGTVPSQTPLHVTVTLRPRDPAALAAYARAVSTPGSWAYRRYLSPAVFGRRFGATAIQVATVRGALQSGGLRPGPASAGGLSIPVEGTAGQFERAFAVTLQTLALPRHRRAVAASARPAVSAAAAPIVQSVLGLDTGPAWRPLLTRRHPDRRGSARAAVVPAPLAARAPHAARSPHATRSPHAISRAVAAPRACAEAQAATATQRGAYTTDQIASAYGFTGAYGAGDGGAGVTVAIYELEPNDPADISHYQSCYGTHAQVSYLRVDGGAGSGPGTGEAALDIENLIGFAPNATVLVYQGPNSQSNAPGSGPYDLFSAIVNQDRAQVVSVSWGQCEQAVTQSSATAENTLFQQATVQGQSIVAADGDSGAQDCNSGSTVPQTQTAVDDPSSQPFVTGVGGTTLSTLGPRPGETVWNSGGAALSSAQQAGASGGGLSSFWPMPPSQLDAAPSLGVRASAGGGSCAGGSGPCRAVPDVSADADPATGYLVYFNGSGTAAGQVGWQSIGGTSGAAPVWAALLTLADGSRGCATAPVGFANPALYRAAAAGYGAGFNDITSGNNDFTGTNGGRYPATPGYDLATGLGTPNASALIPALCADTVHFSAPVDQRSTVRADVRLRLRADDLAGSGVSFAGAGRFGATGLPPGLRLAPSGLIDGHPTRPGRYTVGLVARDLQRATAEGSFTWIVGGSPRISRLSLKPGRRGRSAALSFTITAGRDAPALQALTIGLPAALRLTGSTRAVVISSLGPAPRRLPATARTAGPRTLQITLRAGVGALRVTVPAAVLRQLGAVPHAVRRRTASAILSVSVTDTSAGRLQLHSRLRASGR